MAVVFTLIIPPLPEGGGGILFYYTPTLAFFSVTVDGRNLIFGHKLHIGTPWEQVKSPLTKSPPIMMKSKFIYFYTFFYIDGNIRYIKVQRKKISSHFVYY